MQVGQEWVPASVGNQEYTLLRADTLDFVVLDNELLLEHLDSVELSRSLCFSKHNLTEVTLTEHSKEVEMIEANTLASSGIGSQRQCLVSTRCRLLLGGHGFRRLGLVCWNWWLGKQAVVAVAAVDVAALVVVVAEVGVIGQLVVAGLVVVPGQQEAVLHSQG
jgi:hypothetical protein